MNCSVNDNCRITEAECSEICRAHHAAGFVAGLVTAAAVVALAAFLVCVTI